MHSVAFKTTLETLVHIGGQLNKSLFNWRAKHFCFLLKVGQSSRESWSSSFKSWPKGRLKVGSSSVKSRSKVQTKVGQSSTCCDKKKTNKQTKKTFSLHGHAWQEKDCHDNGPLHIAPRALNVDHSFVDRFNPVHVELLQFSVDYPNKSSEQWPIACSTSPYASGYNHNPAASAHGCFFESSGGARGAGSAAGSCGAYFDSACSDWIVRNLHLQ